MVFRESETVELKEIVVEDIKKEIIAFANTLGGKLYIGVKDDGTIVGLADPDSTALQISNMVRDSIKPDMTMFLHYETVEIENKKIIEVDIQRGTHRPYYLARKGMRSEGVFVRHGYSSASATDTSIRQMIKETDGESFEKMRSLNQELTFDAAKMEFKTKQLIFSPVQMRTLKMINEESLYTNLALLLSDQCTHTIKTAVFQGSDQTILKDRKEFKGSLFKQMNDVYTYINYFNQTHSIFEKLNRIDTRDYPEIAIREALLNLIVHRDYAYSASALISIYANKIEFISIGGLPIGIEYEDIMLGISVCRNNALADIFYRLQLIEAYGTGIRKIMAAYDRTQKKPIIETTKNAFKIILPNINYEEMKENEYAIEVEEKPPVYNGIGFQEKAILKYIQTHEYITKNDVAKLLKVSPSTASRIIRKMIDEDMLKQHGKARSSYYYIE